MPHARVGSEAIDVAGVFRASYGRAVATLTRVFGDITIAEDAVQDAFVIASERWPIDGLPPNPIGWIITTARNRAVDVMRRESRGRELQIQAQQADSIGPAEATPDEEPVSDDQLRLIFTSCHPSLRREHQITLTLRLLGGLSPAEIARAFLITESAVSKRLVRAKYKIKAANIPYRVPADHDLPDRLQSVLSVLYLIYNNGRDDPASATLRPDAIRLARSLVDLMPDEPEAAGLLALLLLDESRAAARTHNGLVVLLRDQDRSRWNHDMIAEAHAIVRACIRRDQPGPFQLQAAIQAVHCGATSYEATDWAQILMLYDHLLAIHRTPVVALNRAIALGEVDGAAAALDVLDDVAAALDDYHLFHATRATTLQRLGRSAEALAEFNRAADLAPLERDRRFLEQQAAKLTEA